MKTICLSCGETFDRPRRRYPEICPKCAKGDLKKAINKLLKSLTEREAKVLKMRWGLENKNEHTLEEVGQQFKVTRERIRQIEKKALQKLTGKKK